MKVLILLVVSLCATALIAQPGMPYCIWEDQNTNQYFFSRLDASTGNLSTIAAIPGLDAFVSGNKTAYDNALDRYHFVGLSNGTFRLYTIDVNTGTVLAYPVFLDNVVGLEYHDNDSLIYGLRENLNNYDLVSLDPMSGVVNSIGPVFNMTAYVVGTFTLDQSRNSYSFVALDGGQLKLRAYDLNDATLLSDAPFPDPLVGLQYNCQDSSVYALWEDGPQYKLERLGLNGIHSTVAVLSNVTPGFVSESSSMEQSGVYTYRGFDGSNNFALISIDVATGVVQHNSQTMDNATGFEESDHCSSVVTGISSDVYKAELTVFPQPCGDQLFLRANDPILSIKVYATGGAILAEFQQMNNSTLHQLNVSALPDGTYVLEVLDDAGHLRNISCIKGR